jgi:hypothetical protein
VRGINNVLKPCLVQKHTQIHLCKTLARSVVCYISEAWTIKKKDKSRITAGQIRFMQRIGGYNKWDPKQNEDVMKELHIEPMLDYIQHYQKQWKNNLQRMNTMRIPKAILHYRPNRKKVFGLSNVQML